MMRTPKIWYWVVVVAVAFAAMVTAGLTIPTPQTAEAPAAGETDTPDDMPEVDVATDTKIQSRDNEPGRAQPTDTPDDTSGIDAATEVEIQRRFNDLRRELLDDRAESINWWLTSIAIFFTFWGIIVAVAGYLGFKGFQEIKNEARQNVEKAREHAEEAQRLIEEIKKYREQADEHLRNITSADSGLVRSIPGEEYSRDPGTAEASPLDKDIADAYMLQQAGKIEEAIEKWRHIAKAAEGTDDDLAMFAWFSVGDLVQQRSRSDKP